MFKRIDDVTGEWLERDTTGIRVMILLVFAILNIASAIISIFVSQNYFQNYFVGTVNIIAVCSCSWVAWRIYKAAQHSVQRTGGASPKDNGKASNASR